MKERRFVLLIEQYYGVVCFKVRVSKDAMST